MKIINETNLIENQILSIYTYLFGFSTIDIASIDTIVVRIIASKTVFLFTFKTPLSNNFLIGSSNCLITKPSSFYPKIVYVGSNEEGVMEFQYNLILQSKREKVKFIRTINAYLDSIKESEKLTLNNLNHNQNDN
jgi:hypothetical protein